LSAERKFSRKFVEVMLSLVVEKRMSKRKIMYAYLSKVSYLVFSFMLFDYPIYFSMLFFKLQINHTSMMKIVMEAFMLPADVLGTWDVWD